MRERVRRSSEGVECWVWEGWRPGRDVGDEMECYLRESEACRDEIEWYMWEGVT